MCICELQLMCDNVDRLQDVLENEDPSSHAQTLWFVCLPVKCVSECCACERETGRDQARISTQLTYHTSLWPYAWEASCHGDRVVKAQRRVQTLHLGERSGFYSSRRWRLKTKEQGGNNYQLTHEESCSLRIFLHKTMKYSVLFESSWSI